MKFPRVYILVMYSVYCVPMCSNTDRVNCKNFSFQLSTASIRAYSLQLKI